MFKVIKHIHPQIFDSMFVQYKNIHNYGTRHAELYCTPLAKTNLMRNSLRCAGVKRFILHNILTKGLLTATRMSTYTLMYMY